MFYFIYTMLGSLCIFFSCINLLPEKLSLSCRLLLLFWTLLSSQILNQLLGQYFVFITLPVILLILYHRTSSKWLCLSCSIFGCLFAVTFNYLCIWSLQKITGMTLSQIQHIPAIALPFSLLYCVLCFVLTKTSGAALNQKIGISRIFSNPRLCMTIFLTLSILGILFVFNFSYGESIGYGYGAIAFNGCSFLAAFIAITILLRTLYQAIRRQEENNSMAEQYENLQTYTRKLEELYNSMRSFKHDYVNLLATMSGYMEENNMKELKSYFYQEILPISHSFSENNSRLSSLSFIENLELKGLLSSKLIRAMELGLHVELEISKPVSAFSMRPVDLALVMGIFLDNAIEAAENTDEKLIRFAVITAPEYLRFLLQNSSLPPECPISRLTEWGVSTKGKHRGIGLYNARTILDAYPQVQWDFHYENTRFTQALTIFSTAKEEL